MWISKDDDDNNIEECLTGPRYSNVVLAMKNYRQSGSGNSSEETEADSSEEEAEIEQDDDCESQQLPVVDVSDPADEDVIPVSDDDVDAAMEQEVQLNLARRSRAVDEGEESGANDDVRESKHFECASSSSLEPHDREKMTPESSINCDRYAVPLGSADSSSSTSSSKDVYSLPFGSEIVSPDKRPT